MTADLEEIRRTLAAQIAPNTPPAGWEYVRLCTHCVDKDPAGDHMCNCEEPCKHMKCPAKGARLDAVVYSQGFVFPPVPVFDA